MPFEPSQPLEQAYYLVSLDDGTERDEVASSRRWLLAEVECQVEADRAEASP